MFDYNLEILHLMGKKLLNYLVELVKQNYISGNRMELLKSNHALTNMTITDLVGEDGTPIGTRVQLVIPIIGK